MTRRPPRFPRPRDCPAQFAHATRPNDDIASFRIGDKRLLQLRVFIVRQKFLHEAGEQLSLNEAEHFPLLYGIDGLRQCGIGTETPNKTKLRGAPPGNTDKSKPFPGASLFNAWL